MEYVSARGARFPALGFGTWEMTGGACRQAVEDAIELGYRHIDTAQAYGNEDQVGAAVQSSGVHRSELWITTKLWYEQLDRDSVLRSTEASLERLRTDYVDLLLIHWPNPAVPVEETLDAMQELHEQGKVHNLGVSNFTPGLLNRAVGHTSVVCNQVEYHPFLDQQLLLQCAEALQVAIVAYSPLARGKVLGSEVLRRIGERHGKSPAQVALRWLLDHGNVAAIPKAASREHARANLDIFDFELLPAEESAIFELGSPMGRLISPPWAPDWEC